MATQSLPRTKRIDADSHFFPQLDFDEITRLLKDRGYPAQEADMIIRDCATFTGQSGRRGGFSRSAQGQKLGATDSSDLRGGGGQAVGMADVEERANLMLETGFDMQVLIPDGVYSNLFWGPQSRPVGMLEEGVRLGLAMGFNNAVGAAQQQRGDRFIGTAIMPIPDVAASCEEATRAVKELGIKVITLPGNWMGTNWDALELYPFWRTVSDLGATIYVHHIPFQPEKGHTDHQPSSYILGYERIRRLHISAYIGFGIEYIWGIACLTLGGVLEEFPNLKFCFFESGATFLPWLMFRLDQSFRVEPQCARTSTKPSELIRRSIMLGVEPDEFFLPQAISAIGSQNFILGSDYPHPPSTFPNTVSGIETMEGLSDEDRVNILGANVARVMNIQ